MSFIRPGRGGIAVQGGNNETALWPNGLVTAASGSLTDVQAAVTAATNGQRVHIPDFTGTWAGSLAIGTKQILVRAKNAGAVHVTNGAGAGNLISFSTGNSYHTCVFGIDFIPGSATGTYITITGSGSKVSLLGKCDFEDTNFQLAQNIDVDSLGGLMWACTINGVAVDIASGCVRIKSPRAWASASTMGSADTNGDVNYYIEDCSFRDTGDLCDADDNARIVLRHNVIDGVSGITHGSTSAQGGRHLEYYDNTFQITSLARNIAARYVWLRAGTAVFTDNYVGSPPDPGEYGDPIQVLWVVENLRRSSPWGQATIYPAIGPAGEGASHQIGWGHNGTSYVSDPVYIWNQTGPRAYTFGFNEGDPNDYGSSNSTGTWVQSARDYFVNAGAKPGYSKYTYPHPLRPTLADNV